MPYGGRSKRNIHVLNKNRLKVHKRQECILAEVDTIRLVVVFVQIHRCQELRSLNNFYFFIEKYDFFYSKSVTIGTYGIKETGEKTSEIQSSIVLNQEISN